MRLAGFLQVPLSFMSSEMSQEGVNMCALCGGQKSCNWKCSQQRQARITNGSAFNVADHLCPQFSVCSTPEHLELSVGRSLDDGDLSSTSRGLAPSGIMNISHWLPPITHLPSRSSSCKCQTMEFSAHNSSRCPQHPSTPCSEQGNTLVFLSIIHHQTHQSPPALYKQSRRQKAEDKSSLQLCLVDSPWCTLGNEWWGEVKKLLLKWAGFDSIFVS